MDKLGKIHSAVSGLTSDIIAGQEQNVMTFASGNLLDTKRVTGTSKCKILVDCPTINSIIATLHTESRKKQDIKIKEAIDKALPEFQSKITSLQTSANAADIIKSIADAFKTFNGVIVDAKDKSHVRLNGIEGDVHMKGKGDSFKFKAKISSINIKTKSLRVHPYSINEQDKKYNSVTIPVSSLCVNEATCPIALPTATNTGVNQSQSQGGGGLYDDDNAFNEFDFSLDSNF